jgi:hypothetical protein
MRAMALAICSKSKGCALRLDGGALTGLLGHHARLIHRF